MGRVHIDPGLDRNQRIVRSVSFYDLIELMTFSQLTFTRSHHMRPEAGRLSPRSAGAAGAAASVMLQSWTLLDDENAIDWCQRDVSGPSIYLVSSIKALASSLLSGEDTDVFIERTCRVVHFPGRSKSARPKAVPIFEDDTLSVIVDAAGDIAQEGQRRNSLRLFVDLRALLIGVIVAPGASIRYVELVSQIVQRATHAFVSRAAPSMEAETARAVAGVRRA